MSLTVEVAGKTDIGCVRTNNEDNFGFDRRYGIYTVCDGMGGQAAGEIASKMAVDTVLTYFRQAAATNTYPTFGKVVEGVSEGAAALASAIHLANQEIHEAATAHAAQAGMGSTITAVLVKDKFFSIAHVGDSRIYLLRPHADLIQQLTNDHSLVMEQVRRGLLTMEEAQRSEMQNIIIRALGPDETVQADLDDLLALPGDMLLLTSDGLTRHVADDIILQIVKAAPNLQVACDDLIQVAKDGGGRDNITCLLLRFVEQSWFKRVLSIFGVEGSPQWQNSI